MAVVGGIFGGLTYWVSRKMDIRLDASPSPYIYDPDAEREFPPLRVGIINDSQRGTNLVAGRLLFKGERIAQLSRVMTGAEGRAISEADLRHSAQQLPIPIPAGGSVPITVLWDPRSNDWTPTTRRFFGAIYPGTRRIDNPRRFGYSVQCPSGAVESVTSGGQSLGPRLAARKIQLEMQFEPGGAERVTLDLRPPGAFGSQQGLVSDWSFGLGLGSVRRLKTRFAIPVRWFWVGREQTAESAPALVTLEFWSGESSTPTSFTRPLRETEMTCFGLRTLAAGRHDWAIRSGGEIVATGVVITPCPEQKYLLYKLRGGTVAPVPPSACAPFSR